uniref:Uncharacterized protein n=1 Tax=Proboscia inermis TaxID=420281 RepID=A0A7S0BYU6_9STRA|mmetsp:Transcript_1469/g.1525  ORF Transcript_1469/g.1525 Transcript_1469/m.1525 type:complete len:300 (+) Transcript_1469:709-1608(+)
MIIWRNGFNHRNGSTTRQNYPKIIVTRSNPMSTSPRKVAADKFGCDDSKTIAMCELVSKAHDARVSGDIVIVPEELKTRILCDGWPCWWQHDSIKRSKRRRYSPHNAEGKALAVLFNSISNYQFGLPPIQLDPHLEFPLSSLAEFNEDDYAFAQHLVKTYYTRKREMVGRKTEGFQRSFMKANNETWRNTFDELDLDLSKDFLGIGPSKWKRSKGAEMLKHKASALYRASFERRKRGTEAFGKPPSSTLLQVPKVLEYLVQIKNEALDEELLSQGFTPPTHLLLSQSKHYRVKWIDLEI